MAEIVTMPRLSDTMTEGTVAKWHKKIGDKVSEGDLLAEIETDKATMEFEAFQEGVLLHIGVEEGNGAPVDSILAILGKEGEDISGILKGDKPAEPKKEASEPVKDEVKESTPDKGSSESSASSEDSRLKISPLAKKLAEEKGIELSKLSGSGENGRIVKRDIENYKAEEKSAPQVQVAAPAGANYTEESVSQMRKTIAKRLSESKFSAPHFYLTMEINMDKAIEVRKQLNEISNVKISFNDLVIKSVAVALKKNPKVNSSWLGDKIRFNQDINIGVAVAVEEGLLVPVIRNADTKGLSAIAAQVKEFAGKAKDKKLQPSDWEGNTFTISNLGMYGIEEFTAIINPPDACILAVGGIKETPIVKDGAIKIGNIMKVTLSCDHRAVDGAVGSAFLQDLKRILENPLGMIL